MPAIRFVPARRPARYFALLAVTASVAAATACSSSSSPAGSGSGSGSSSSSGSTADLGLISDGTIQSAITAGGAPFATTTKSGDPEGFLIDLNNDISQSLGVKITYKVTTTDPALAGLTAGKYDLLSIGLVATPARAQNAFFSKDIFYGYNDVVVKAGSAVAAPADLAGKRVGVSVGSTQDDYAKATLTKATLVDEALNATAITQLTAGSVDAIVLGGTQAGTLMNESPGKYKIAFGAAQTSPGAVAISKKETGLQTAYNAQLTKLVNDGTFLKLYDKWIAPLGNPFPAQLYTSWPALKSQVAADPKAQPKSAS
jgi:ABC-type amino acid transport substrate-binding protein